MKRKIIWYGILILIIATSLYIVFNLIDNSEDYDREAAIAKRRRQNEVRRKTYELYSKYNAVTDWKQRFQKKAFGQHTYTVEVEDALIRTDRRPILFYGVVDDVVKETDKYVVYWSAGLSSHGDALLDFVSGRDFRFVLDCTPSQVEKIMDNSVSILDFYAVVAQISKVEKVRFKLSSGERGEKVQVNTADVFLAKGECLDLLFFPDEGAHKQDNKQLETPSGNH